MVITANPLVFLQIVDPHRVLYEGDNLLPSYGNVQDILATSVWALQTYLVCWLVPEPQCLMCAACKWCLKCVWRTAGGRCLIFFLGKHVGLRFHLHQNSDNKLNINLKFCVQSLQCQLVVVPHTFRVLQLLLQCGVKLSIQYSIAGDCQSKVLEGDDFSHQW